MMPAYKYVDSNPHHRNQAPFPRHYFPGFEAAPPHLKFDPSKPPMMSESWPCSSNYGYYVPYHGCCNHGNFPGCYSFRPPCSHFAPSPAFHHYPNYPTFPKAYPVYFASPPHYSNEQPRYEYDKDAHTNHHCCGCSNHPYNQKNNTSLKIEEQKPDAGEKEGDSGVPIQPRSYPYPTEWMPPEYMKNNEYGKLNDQPEVHDFDKAPHFMKPSKNWKPAEQQPNSYPIVWIPPEYMKSKEYGKRNDQAEEVSGWDKTPHFMKPSKGSKPTEEEPRVWNGWFPLDLNGLKSLMQGEGEKKSQNHQNEDKVAQLPFPVFWVPSNGKQVEDKNQDKRRMIIDADHTKQAPVSFEFIPAEKSVHNVGTDKPQSDEVVSDKENASETIGKSANKKCVPVKQMEVSRKDKPERIEKRREINVKRTEDTTKNENGGNAEKRKSQSPPKTSKLPPVCLRVDPLPKKRNGNGSSRSPSPPRGQQGDVLAKASNASDLKADIAANGENPNVSLDKVQRGGKKRKDIQVMEKKSMENKGGEYTTASQVQALGNLPIDTQEVSGKPTVEKTEIDTYESNTEEEKDASSKEIMRAKKAADTMKASHIEESAQSQQEVEVKRLSEAEAAKLIQSAYRGFEVRKWEPLKKLKQIAKAREQLDEVRNRIQALESSFDLNQDDRQRLLIGEMIMNLLLKLDTVQGLHSSVRDARKSLVRELVTLQEKLDSLASKWVEEKAKELAIAESADCPRLDASSNAINEKESGKASADCISSFEDANEKGNSIKGPDQQYVTCMVDEKSNVKDEEITEPLNVDQAMDGKIENETAEVHRGIECNTAPRVQDGGMSPCLEVFADLSSVSHQSNAEELMEANGLTREGKLGQVEVNDWILVNGDSREDKLGLLPKEMTDKTDDICEPEDEIENGNGEKESDMLINPALPTEVESLRSTREEQEIDLLEELPVGIIDEPAISESEKCEMDETGESNILPLTEGCFVGPEEDEHLLEATSGISEEDQKEHEFNKNPELKVEVDLTLEKDVKNENKVDSVSEPEKLPSTVGEDNDKVHEEEDDYGAIPADHMASSESEAGSVSTQEKEVLFEEKKEMQQPVETEEKELKPEREIEIQEQKCMNDEEKTTNMPYETSEVGVLVEIDAHPEPNVVEQDLLPASPAVSQMSNDEHDLAKIGGDEKLIEENKKLREMMGKLMEAGKAQLNVISNLTGRVKELEEKLSRNKKMSKPRYRKARYAPSCFRTVRVRGMPAEAAM
ncbi:hypothetical protein DITRI_Ditri11bG0145400 [Diplodiscus trichospermus]